MKIKDGWSQNARISDNTSLRPTRYKPAKRMKNERSGGGVHAPLKILPLLPLLVAVGVVPLVVYLKVKLIPPVYRQFWVTDYVFDFFSFYKAQIVLACAGLVLAAVLLLYVLGRLPRKKTALYIPLAIYAAMLVASTLASKHPSIALGGFFDRAEGMWVLLAYVVLLVGTYLFVSDTLHAWWILTVWAAALSAICILGIFQFFGIDFFGSLLGRLLIIPAQYHRIESVLDFNFPHYWIYATLYNPNYVASMLSLAFPLVAACFVLSGSRRRQVVFGTLSGLFCLTLVGANARAAWIAVLFSLLLLMGLSFKRGAAGWWKRLGILGLVAVLEFAALDLASGGALGRRDSQATGNVQQVMENGTAQNIMSGSSVPPGTDEGLAERLIRKYGSVGSGRGYIWIRSLQMAGETVFLGRGPDTFALYFPNTDPYKAFYTQPQIFIDKPHNMYLQLWLNLGGVAALAFLAMVVLHAIRTFRVLKRAKPAGDHYMLALGLFIGWFAYLLAAFFYDSVVSVAPVFWIVFGLSMAMNETLEAGNSR
jgi:hypothetical protein